MSTSGGDHTDVCGRSPVMIYSLKDNIPAINKIFAWRSFLGLARRRRPREETGVSENNSVISIPCMLSEAVVIT